MKRKRREVPTASLSFLDCISCGFGAAVLLFMLVDHARKDLDLTSNFELVARVNALEEQLLDDRQSLLAMRAGLDTDETALETAQREAERLKALIEQLRSELPQAEDSATTQRSKLEKLQLELLALESRVDKMRAASKDASGNATRTVIGEGRRQYLQGLDVSGDRILILVDRSASMLGNTVVDAIRRRNMSESSRRAAPKWTRTVATVDWLTAQMDPRAQFQILSFAETTKPLSGSGWLSAAGGKQLDESVSALRALTPGGGTSLVNAFAAAAAMSPRPDNIYLITDGLPTQGRTPVAGTVSGRERVKNFEQAADALPRNVPVNVILLPMEGDPKASALFWQLARTTGGTLLEPSADWP